MEGANRVETRDLLDLVEKARLSLQQGRPSACCRHFERAFVHFDYST